MVRPLAPVIRCVFLTTLLACPLLAQEPATGPGDQGGKREPATDSLVLESPATAGDLDSLDLTDTRRAATIPTKLTVLYDIGEKEQNCLLSAVSEDASHALLTILEPKHQFVVFGDAQSKNYDAILDVYVSRTGRHFGFFAQKKKDYYAVVDGKEYGKFLERGDSIYFSPDEDQFIFYGVKPGLFKPSIAIYPDGHERVVDNVLSTGRDYYSRDGNQWAYFYRDGERCVPVINGQDLSHYDMTGAGPVFAEGKPEVAFAGKRNDTVFVVVNGREIGGYSRVKEIVFSPDEAELAYIAQLNYDIYVYRDTARFGPFDDAWHITYGRGGHFAFVARRDSTIVVNSDGVESTIGWDVSWPVYSADGSRMAYVAFMSNDTDTSFASQAAVVDGEVQPAYHFVYFNLRFSPDGRRFAYIAEIDTLRVVAVVDGLVGPEYSRIDGIEFADDGSEYAYQGQIDDTTWCVVRNGVEISRYRDIGPIAYSKDGRHLAYVALTAKGLRLIMDGTPVGEGYSRILPARPRFDSDGNITYYGEQSRRRIHRVTALIGDS